MKPNLLIQLILVILSLVLLLVAVFFPRRERIVPTEIIIEMNDQTIVLRSRGANPSTVRSPARQPDSAPNVAAAPAVFPPNETTETDETNYR